MTYREEIQKMIKQLQDLYDKAGHLRDQSDPESQILLNDFRRLIPDTWDILQKQDDRMPEWLANAIV